MKVGLSFLAQGDYGRAADELRAAGFGEWQRILGEKEFEKVRDDSRL
jgi:hypothetical protein